MEERPTSHLLPDVEPAHLIGGSTSPLPHAFHLFPGERVKSVELVPWHRPSLVLSNDQVLARLARVSAAETLGNVGMPLASVALEARRGEGLFETEIARDALIMAKFGHDRFPRLTEVVVKRLAEVQGIRDEDGPDTEKVGQIPHEIRPEGDAIRDLLTATWGWQWPYFGSKDATPLWISAAVRAEHTRTGFLCGAIVQRLDGTHRTVISALADALGWLVNQVDANAEGLLESEPASNMCWQSWADSPDAYHHADGRLARGRVAALEVQAYAYDALCDVAGLLSAQPQLSPLLGFSPQELRERARRLRGSVLRLMWVTKQPGGDFFAIGVERHEGRLSPLAIRSVNMAVILDTGLLDGEDTAEHVGVTIEHCMNPAQGMLKPNGIVSVGPESPRFRPAAYHNGSIWLWTMYEIANGLDRHGRRSLARELRAKADHACFRLNCYPEKMPGTDAGPPHMDELMIHLVSPDGHGGEFAHCAAQPGQIYQGFSAFGFEQSQRLARIPTTYGPAPSAGASEQDERILEQISLSGPLLGEHDLDFGEASGTA